jgi:hypothetical protein
MTRGEHEVRSDQRARARGFRLSGIRSDEKDRGVVRARVVLAVDDLDVVRLGIAAAAPERDQARRGERSQSEPGGHVLRANAHVGIYPQAVGRVISTAFRRDFERLQT